MTMTRRETSIQDECDRRRQGREKNHPASFLLLPFPSFFFLFTKRKKQNFDVEKLPKGFKREEKML